MRAKLFAAGLSAAALTLAGCGGGGSGPAGPVASAADIASCDPAGVTLTATYNQQAEEAMKVAVAKLKADHPGIEVNTAGLSVVGYDDLTKTIVSDIAVGKRPDVIMSGLGQLRFWVDTYKPAPIDPAALPATYQKQFLGAGTVNGTVYLAPSQISAPVLLVNDDLLTAAGAGEASGVRTYADLIAAAQKVTARTGKPSVTIPAGALADWHAQAFVQAAKGTFVTPDGAAGFGDPAGKEALGIWSTLKAQNLELGVGDLDARAQFTTGNAAFYVTTTSAIAAVSKDVGGKFGWTPVDLPSSNGAGGPLPAGGNGWVVLSDDACRAAFANELVSDLLGKEAVLAASGKAFSYIPVDTEAGRELLGGAGVTPQLQYAWSYAKPLTEWGGFPGAKTTQVNDTLRSMTQALQGGAETGPAVDEAVASVNAITGKG